MSPFHPSNPSVILYRLTVKMSAGYRTVTYRFYIVTVAKIVPFIELDEHFQCICPDQKSSPNLQYRELLPFNQFSESLSPDTGTFRSFIYRIGKFAITHFVFLLSFALCNSSLMQIYCIRNPLSSGMQFYIFLCDCILHFRIDCAIVQMYPPEGTKRKGKPHR